MGGFIDGFYHDRLEAFNRPDQDFSEKERLLTLPDQYETYLSENYPGRQWSGVCH